MDSSIWASHHYVSVFNNLQEVKRLPSQVSPCRRIVSGNDSDFHTSNTSSIVAQFQRSNSVTSIRSFERSEEFTTSVASTSSSSTVKKRRHKIREISIEDSPPKNITEVVTETNGRDHLETKEKVEKFRKQLGSAWLVASSRLSNSDQPSKFMGGAPLPKAVQPVLADLKINSQNQEVIGEINIENIDVVNSTLINDNGDEESVKNFQVNDNTITDLPDKKSEENENSTEKLTLEMKPEQDNEEKIIPSEETGSTFVWTNSDFENSNLSDNNVGDPDELTTLDDEQPFIVNLHRHNDVATLLVSIQGDYLRERDSLTGRTLECLDIRSLLSLEKVSDPPYGLRLTFDYIRKDRRERIYELEDDENFQLFVNLLQPVLEAKTLEEMRRGALQCLACGAQFSKEVAKLKLQSSKIPSRGEPENLAQERDYLREVNACPNCDSQMIIELDDAPLPQTQDKTHIVTKSIDKDRSSINKMDSIRFSLKQKIRKREETNKPNDQDISNDRNCEVEEPHSSKSLPSTPVLKHHLKNSLRIENQQNRGLLERQTRNQLFSNGGILSSSPTTQQSKCRSLGNSPLSASPGSNQISYSDVYPRDETREASIVNIREESPDEFGNVQNFTINNCNENYEYNEMFNSALNSQAYKLPRKGSGNFSSFYEDVKKDENKDRRFSTPVITPGMRRSESDVTILSNPSQSSISVLSTPSGDQTLLSILEKTPNETHENIKESSTALYQQDLSQNKNFILHNSDGSKNEHFGSSSSGSLSSSTGTAIEKSLYEGSGINFGLKKSFTSSRVNNGPTSAESVFESTAVLSDSSTFYSAIDDSDSIDGATSPQSDDLHLQSDSFSRPLSPSEGTLKNEAHLDSNINSENANSPICNSEEDDVVLSHMIKYSYHDYSQIDHRIRLYIDMTFFGEGESFELILRSIVIAPTKINEFTGLLIISTKNVYIFRITGEENNEPAKWLHKVDVKNLSQLKTVKAHLGCQGFILEFGSPTSISYLFLLRDVDRCNRFMDRIVDLKGVFGSADVIRNPEQSVKSYLQSALNDDGNNSLTKCEEENFNDILLYILGSFVKENKGIKVTETVSFVITPTYIHAFTENNQTYITPAKSGKENIRRQPFQFKEQQKISDLVEATLTNCSNEVKLCFLNEDSGTESQWHVAMETSRSLSLLITTLQEPWKLLFNIDLPINRS